VQLVILFLGIDMFYFPIVFIISSLALLVMGCQQDEHTLNYLLQHPLVLEKEFTRCQALKEVNPAQEEQCALVTKAVNQVSIVANQQRYEPEKFGLRILTAQMEINTYTTELVDAKKELVNLKDEKKAKRQQIKIDDLQMKMVAKQDEVKMMLAVMGLSTPE
jgi:hypothetical protein